MTKLKGQQIIEMMTKHPNIHKSDLGVRCGYDNGYGDATLEFYNELVRATMEHGKRLSDG